MKCNLFCIIQETKTFQSYEWLKTPQHSFRFQRRLIAARVCVFMFFNVFAHSNTCGITRSIFILDDLSLCASVQVFVSIFVCCCMSVSGTLIRHPLRKARFPRLHGKSICTAFYGASLYMLHFLLQLSPSVYRVIASFHLAQHTQTHTHAD